MRLHSRLVKEGFWTDTELIRELPLEGRLFYLGLIQLADDSGCLKMMLWHLRSYCSLEIPILQKTYLKNFVRNCKNG